MKNKLKNENNEVVSVTNQLKLTAPDGKKYLKMFLITQEFFLLQHVSLTPRPHGLWNGLPTAMKL